MDLRPPTSKHRWRCWLRRRRLAAWLELTQAQRASVAAGCVTCDACRAELDAMRALDDALRAARDGYRGLRYEGPRPAWDGVSVSPRPGSPRPVPSARRRALWTAVATVATTVVALGLYSRIDRDGVDRSSASSPRPAPRAPAADAGPAPGGVPPSGPRGAGEPAKQPDLGTPGGEPGPASAPLPGDGGGESVVVEPPPGLPAVAAMSPRRFVHATPRLPSRITVSGFAALRQRAASSPRIGMPRKPAGLVLRSPVRPTLPVPDPVHGDDD